MSPCVVSENAGGARDFTPCARLADEQIEQATKGPLGYHHERYGDVPKVTLLEIIEAKSLDEETKRPKDYRCTGCRI